MTAQHTSLVRRLAAILYDSLLVSALLFLVTVPFVAIRGGEPVAIGDNRPYQLTLLIVVYAFFAGFWSVSGRTLGMQTWGLRIEAANGTLPSLGTATVRFIAAIMSWLPLGLGFLWQLWDNDRLAWHDRISGTRIVHDPRPAKHTRPAR